MAKNPLPPWRRIEKEDSDQDGQMRVVATATMAKNQGSECSTTISSLEENRKNMTPTPECYVYNGKNVTPGVKKPEANANLASVKPLSDTVYNTCQNSPCLKYEGKEDEGPRMTGVFSLDTKFDLTVR